MASFDDDVVIIGSVRLPVICTRIRRSVADSEARGAGGSRSHVPDPGQPSSARGARRCWPGRAELLRVGRLGRRGDVELRGGAGLDERDDAVRAQRQGGFVLERRVLRGVGTERDRRDDHDPDGRPVDAGEHRQRRGNIQRRAPRVRRHDAVRGDQPEHEPRVHVGEPTRGRADVDRDEPRRGSRRPTSPAPRRTSASSSIGSQPSRPPRTPPAERRPGRRRASRPRSITSARSRARRRRSAWRSGSSGSSTTISTSHQPDGRGGRMDDQGLRDAHTANIGVVRLGLVVRRDGRGQHLHVRRPGGRRLGVEDRHAAGGQPVRRLVPVAEALRRRRLAARLRLDRPHRRRLGSGRRFTPRPASTPSPCLARTPVCALSAASKGSSQRP